MKSHSRKDKIMTLTAYEELDLICYYCSKEAAASCDFCTIPLCKNHVWNVVDQDGSDFTWLLCESCADEDD